MSIKGIMAALFLQEYSSAWYYGLACAELVFGKYNEGMINLYALIGKGLVYQIFKFQKCTTRNAASSIKNLHFLHPICKACNQVKNDDTGHKSIFFLVKLP